jgi:hypothetical protein
LPRCFVGRTASGDGRQIWKTGTKAIYVANNVRAGVEIARLDEALENFCMHFGSYPPDCHDQAAVRKFLKAKFPQCPPENYPDPAAYGPDS